LLSPFGVVCRDWPAEAARPGTVVRAEAGEVIVGDWLTIAWRGANVIDCRLPQAAPMPSVFDCLTRALPGSDSELLHSFSAVLMGTDLRPNPLSKRAGPLVNTMYEATRVLDEAGVLQTSLELIGLGPGLTPAGDDFLVGWMVGAAVGGDASRKMLEFVGPRILEYASMRTTWLSTNFLRAALSRLAAETVCAFVRAPDSPNMGALIALGSTSGADLLSGYLLARSAFVQQEQGKDAGRSTWPPR
jgi:hypothetical protein